MKSRLFISTVIVSCSLMLCGAAQAGPKNHRNASRAAVVNGSDEEYVVVTGSNIPRKVKVRSLGTDTPDNLRIYGQRELESTGHATVGEQLRARDASISLGRR